MRNLFYSGYSTIKQLALCHLVIQASLLRLNNPNKHNLKLYCCSLIDMVSRMFIQFRCCFHQLRCCFQQLRYCFQQLRCCFQQLRSCVQQRRSCFQQLKLYVVQNTFMLPTTSFVLPTITFMLSTIMLLLPTTSFMLPTTSLMLPTTKLMFLLLITRLLKCLIRRLMFNVELLPNLFLKGTKCFIDHTIN